MRFAPTPLSERARALFAQSRRFLFALAFCGFIAGALNLPERALADAGEPDLANGVGDDPTQPFGKIELLDRYTVAPGPGVDLGTTKQVQTNTPFARIEAPFRLTSEWELSFRAEIPVVSTNGVTPGNPTGAVVSGFGNVLAQAWVVRDIDQRWAIALGGQLIAPTSTNGVASNAWEQVTGFVVRAMLPEISPGSYFAPQVRYGIDFEGNDDGAMLRQLRIAPTLNINLPHRPVFHALPQPGHSIELWDAGLEPDGPLVPAAEFHGWLEADRTYRDFGGVRHSDHTGFSSLRFQELS